MKRHRRHVGVVHHYPYYGYGHPYPYYDRYAYDRYRDAYQEPTYVVVKSSQEQKVTNTHHRC